MAVIVDARYRRAPLAAVEELYHFRATHPLKSITLDGVQWDYLISGQGRATLLILPGLLGLAEMSFQHITIFEQTHQVIVPSYPFGLGTLDRLVGGLAALLDAAQIERVHMLGGSFGGLVAQRFVRAWPERVRRLVLSHTGGPRPDRARTNQRAVTLLQLLPMGVLRFMLRGATRQSLRDAPEHSAFWEAYSAEMITRLTKADLVSRYQLAADFDATSRFTPADLHAWPGRVLILEGDNDPVAELPARDHLKRLYPQAQVHVFHGSGHVASIARLEEYTAVIRQFLSD